MSKHHISNYSRVLTFYDNLYYYRYVSLRDIVSIESKEGLIYIAYYDFVGIYYDIQNKILNEEYTLEDVLEKIYPFEPL